MAVTFNVEDGSGETNSNSYCTIEFADDYLSIKSASFTTTWDALTDEQKENALMWGSRVLDQRARWVGTRAHTDQAMGWPRIGARDRDGFIVADDIVPLQVQQAAVEMAFHLITEDVDPSAPGAGSSGGIKRLKAAVLEIEYQDNAVITPNYFPVGLNSLLFPLGSIGGAGGSGFARIIRA
jgi:hypothetical protein